MNLENDIARANLQEKTLQFDQFDTTTAWTLGCLLKESAEAQGVAVAIDITLAGTPLFIYAMAGTNPGHADWIRRKRNTVMRFGKSSFLVGLDTQKMDTTLDARTGSTRSEYEAVGGSFPIRLRGSANVIGAVSVSGLAPRADHMLIVTAIARHLQADLATLALEG
ncbi:heme-degrading domain-containing protein [Uliginosibacterium sp. H3]|uniref:Heme-degrading domain-containing protein n=1 Tax=Uliginosibacterium silvisoli TaxID=3114758 RepID=A0ABU6JYG3_9RHOO|nr:heme-degrading domain-containing protein [Uliginosibacterium sp. H3]